LAAAAAAGVDPGEIHEEEPVEEDGDEEKKIEAEEKKELEEVNEDLK
jgi:hypothetical protein